MDIEQLEEEMRNNWKRLKCVYCKTEFRKTYTIEKYCSVKCYKNASQQKASAIYFNKKYNVSQRKM